MVGNQDTANGITSSKLWALDLADGGSVAFNLDATATKSIVVERVGVFDLDEIRQPLDGYKVVTRMLLKISTENNNTQVFFEFGASDIPNQNPNYSSAATFDISTDYKIDSRAAGRYLSYKMTVGATILKISSFQVFDLDVTTTGSV